MKKTSIVLGMLVVIAFSGIAMAQTTVDTNWNGAGTYHIHFVAGDDSDTTFNTGGNTISGEFHSVDSDNNPYHYNVDSTSSRVKAHVDNGYIEYQFNRTDSYSPMYGDAGQVSYTLIDTTGTGDFAWSTTSNFAQMRSCNYGWQSSNQIQATGIHYIDHYLAINDHEGAEIIVDANGNTAITDMSEDHSGSSYQFGKGCGCYTNAHVDITGSGSFDLTAVADHQITTDFGITTDGYLNVHSDFGSGFHFSDYGLAGN